MGPLDTPGRYEDKFYELIEASANGEPRTTQTKIGPSSLGTDCIHCLACGIFQIRKPPDGRRIFKQWVGNQCHEGMQKILEKANMEAGRQLYYPERKVTVGMIGPMVIKGTADCYDVEERIVVDWKFPGDITVDKARRGNIATTYKKQPHLYGLGYENAGVTVKGCMVLFLPVTKGTAREGVAYKVAYSRSLAEDTMARANALYDAVLANGGPEHAIPKLKRDPGCYDCLKYPI
jgi:hypothetical protein